MSPRRSTIRFTFACIALAGAVVPSFAQPTPLPGDVPADQIDNAAFPQTGEVNANNVYVRSGASEGDYPVLKLDRGSRLAVVGVKFDWLKIKPPAGSFCCVAKAFVDRRGDGKVGRVNTPLYVRVGSNISELRNKVAMRLEPNADVTIIGEEDEYFVIEPPEGVYVYVARRFVDPVVTPEGVAGGSPNGGGTVDAPPSDPDKGARPGSETTGPTDSGTAAPTTRQTPGSEQFAKLRELEDRRVATEAQPLEQQPLDELIAAYQTLAGESSSPESIKQMCEMRIKGLQSRKEARDGFREQQRVDKEAAERSRAREAEGQEMIDRIQATAVTHFVAVGTLRASSLQYGGQTLYRVTDPATGRTVLYVRSTESAVASMLGQFVGVQGEVTDDTRMMLKYITPTLIDVVDPALVNSKITADYIPPSMSAGARATP